MPAISGAYCTVQPMLYRTVSSLLMTQLEDLDSLCVSTGYPSGMRPVRFGAGRGARGGEGGAWARAPGVARVLFLGFFFSTRSSRALKSKNRPLFHKKQA
jgi:hypothetical protein